MVRWPHIRGVGGLLAEKKKKKKTKTPAGEKGLSGKRGGEMVTFAHR